MAKRTGDVVSQLYVPVFYVVSRFAKEKIQPLVRDMDNASEMNKSVINALFEQGVSSLAYIVPEAFFSFRSVTSSLSCPVK